MAVHVGTHLERAVGIVTLVGTGEFADTIVEVVLDAPAMAGLEAALGETRQLLRNATTSI